MSRISITVVIPAYNAEGTLDRAIRSVLDQSYPLSEIIVVDDGSKDGTSAVAAKYAESIRYVRQENGGVSVARNRGISEAASEWIAFLDADDEWLPGKLAEQVELLRSCPDLKWLCTNMEIAGDSSAKVIEIPTPFRSSVDRGEPIPFFQSSRAGVQFQTSGFIIHRSVFHKVGDFDTKLRVCQDRDLWWRIAVKHPLVGYAAIAGHRYYVNVNGSLTKGSPGRDVELENVCERVLIERRSQISVMDLEAHAKAVAWSYLLRAKTGAVSLKRSTVDKTSDTFAFDLRERFLLRIVDFLPKPVAVRFVRRLT